MKTPSRIFFTSRSFNVGWTLFLLTAITFTFTQCGSDDPKPADKPADVYVAGRYYNGTTKVPAYWKNGELVELSESQGNVDVIAVVGDNVYAVGYLETDGLKKKLWTNGVETEFSGDNATYYDQYTNARVFGKDWYLVGYRTDLDGQHAAYWKNGVIHIVETDVHSSGYDIAVDGNDVYVVGNRYGNDGAHAAYWKNDVGHDLSPNIVGSSISGIAINGDDIYMAGNLGSTLTAWKNDAPLTLANSEDSYTGNGNIAVVNNDVYVMGFNMVGNKYAAQYWKNGVSETLPIPDGATGGFAYTIAVSKNDIYFLGETKIGNTYSTLVWKNFELVTPFDGTPSINAYGFNVTK